MRTTTLKTYSHLAGRRRMPTEYEIVTSKLHYYVDRGFEVDTPLAAWFARHQGGSPLALEAAAWDEFRDPRETTYTRYVALQKDKETHLGGVLDSIERTDYDAALPAAAVELLERTLAPIRFPLHGLQMAAAYVGQLAPSGRITIAAALQTADELRRIERIAQRIAMLRRRDDGFGRRGAEAWHRDPAWQPLRRLVEELLVTYDWGEAFCALALGVKPALDLLLMNELPDHARGLGDYLLGELTYSLDQDCAWHRQWSGALVGLARRTRAANGDVLRGWLAGWLPRVAGAIDPLAAALAPAADGIAARVHARHRAWLAELEVAP
jgi:toluene monooxygenase system protein E